MVMSPRVIETFLAETDQQVTVTDVIMSFFTSVLDRRLHKCKLANANPSTRQKGSAVRVLALSPVEERFG